MISPISFDRPDPIKEFADKLQASGDSEEWKLGRNLQPKMRTYVPILVRGEEEDGVRFWGFGIQIYKQLGEKMDNPMWGDLSHPQTGRDIDVFFEKRKNPKSFPKTSIDVHPNQSYVTQNPKILELIKEMPKVSTLWVEPSYQELQNALQDFVGGGGVPAEVDTVRDRRSSSDVEVTEAIAAGNTSETIDVAGGVDAEDINKAFEGYFPKKG